jgi:hypothetical protein
MSFLACMLMWHYLSDALHIQRVLHVVGTRLESHLFPSESLFCFQVKLFDFGFV